MVSEICLWQPATRRMQTIKVLIVSTSDVWHRSVSSLLASFSHFQLLGSAHGGLTAYEMLREQRPHLLLIDNSLPQDEAFRLISAVKAVSQQIYCILLVATSRQARVALAAGADAVVLRSGSSRQLETAVLAARDRIAALK